MTKEEILQSLSTVEYALKDLRSKVHQTPTQQVTQRQTKALAQKIAQDWFEQVEIAIGNYEVSEDVRKKYHEAFTKLLSLSVANSRKRPYEYTINGILQSYKDEIIVPVIKSAKRIVSTTELAKILDNVSDDEKQYLTEALGCAANGFLRAAVVLGWCAAVHRMHKVVERLGFDEFNKKSQEMKLITQGRFKRFGKSFDVHSINELNATVFDNDLLWVLEYWGLLDANQHDRLSTCFTMRNNSAHPGEAPITEPNLASFYSDLKEMIFDNPKFKLNDEALS